MGLTKNILKNYSDWYILSKKEIKKLGLKYKFGEKLYYWCWNSHEIQEFYFGFYFWGNNLFCNNHQDLRIHFFDKYGNDAGSDSLDNSYPLAGKIWGEYPHNIKIKKTSWWQHLSGYDQTYYLEKPIL